MDRLEAWDKAKDLVQPIVDKHELKDHNAGNIFAPAYTTTKVDQHIENIMKVAEWLREEDLNG